MRHAPVISTTAPPPVGPYSQAIIAGNFVFVSGQIGLGPSTGALAEGAAAQARQALKNLAAVLSAANAKLDDVVKTEIFLADMNDFAVVNGVYEESFRSQPYPARQTIESPHLPKGALVEISCVAVTQPAL